MALAMQFDQSTQDLIFFRGYTAPPSPFTVQEAIAQSATKAVDKVQAVSQLASWFQKNYPDLYTRIMNDQPGLLMPDMAMAGLSGLRGLGQDQTASTTDTTTPPSTDWGQTLSSFVSQVLGPLASAYQQKQIIDVNIKRAEQGLQPLDVSQIAPTVNVGVSPQVQQMGIIAGLGIAALIVTVMVISRKKR
jgi:hypothetical protein